MDGGAWWAAVRGVTQSWTRLSDFIFTFHFLAVEKEMASIPVFLPGESQGRGSLVGCRLWGRTESDTTEGTQQQGHWLINIIVTRVVNQFRGENYKSVQRTFQMTLTPSI